MLGDWICFMHPIYKVGFRLMTSRVPYPLGLCVPRISATWEHSEHSLFWDRSLCSEFTHKFLSCSVWRPPNLAVREEMGTYHRVHIHLWYIPLLRHGVSYGERKGSNHQILRGSRSNPSRISVRNSCATPFGFG